jgi:DNA repair protein RadC
MQAASISPAKARKAPPRRRAPLAQPLPTSNLADGACSFRHTLTACERTALDRALDIVGRTLASERLSCDSSAAVKDYMRLQLGGEQAEHFAVLFLDIRHRAIAFERMFTGTLSHTSVHPREVVTAALRHHAAAVVLAHNHPSGDLQPSGPDEAVTSALKSALALIDVRVLDHIIVSSDGALSMAEKGLT